ncbi:hypothetical protein IB238_09085 [Rhizobium sp. ARZ01]|uniref:hypothetical protein n=1 Tax=Rhizobium sp. ARZ01 TaxID=2769313 RepID=UPI001784A82F|nr:hypothetical protein [Rhizobium sp. ARZ01]MBD9372774.1 hypothetical protein [Rhizobium sp. ARZ01]
MGYVDYSRLFVTAASFAALASTANAEPYQKFGVVNCALPGTTIEFSLNGSGGADVASSSSNFAPFREAARVKTWSANVEVKDGTRLLILDNLKNTRIMIRLPDGKGMAFTGADGVSDILCQVLIQPD